MLCALSKASTSAQTFRELKYRHFCVNHKIKKWRKNRDHFNNFP